MKLSQALQRLKGMTAWDQEPALSESDLTALLTDSRRPDADGNPIEDVVSWEPDTSYVGGDRITAGDGYAYICTEEGNTGLTEPAWDAVTTDGTVVWQRDGASAWTPTYDANYAAAEAWMLKSAKAASMISFTADGAKLDRAQYLANCRTMAEHYRARIVASVRVAPQATRKKFGYVTRR